MRRSHPPHPKEEKTGDHQYPRGNPPPQQKTATLSPKARETAVNRRREQEHAEVPPMKERPAVGGGKPDPKPRKPRKIERFSSCRRVEGTGDQQQVPGHQNSITAPLVDEQRTTRSSVRKRPNATAGWRTGHGSDKEAQKQAPDFEAAPMWLNPHQKLQGTALPPLTMQKQPQET